MYRLIVYLDKSDLNAKLKSALEINNKGNCKHFR